MTNNGDIQKVLAIVAAILYAFSDKNPDAFVIATGSIEARTRLYRMGITNNIKEVANDFLILGLTESRWEEFRKNVTFGAFLGKRKF